jgi:hypothetical protein
MFLASKRSLKYGKHPNFILSACHHSRLWEKGQHQHYVNHPMFKYRQLNELLWEAIVQTWGLSHSNPWYFPYPPSKSQT